MIRGILVLVLLLVPLCVLLRPGICFDDSAARDSTSEEGLALPRAPGRADEVRVGRGFFHTESAGGVRRNGQYPPLFFFVPEEYPSIRLFVCFVFFAATAGCRWRRRWK